MRPTPTAPPSDAPTEAPEERKEETCPQDSPRYIKQEPIILDQVGVRRAWDISRGAGVTVAVVDSGVAAGNEHFNSGDPSVVLPGIDLSGEGTDGRVDVGEHGTAIAGAIAARQLPAAKGSGLIGVAPEAKILPVRIETGLEQGNTDKPGQEPFMSRVARAIRWAADNGAQIIVVAQSSKDPNSDLEAAVAAVRGRALVVASTGNTYQDQKDNEVVYPAAYEGVLAVTASDANGFASDQQVHGAHVDLAVPAAVIHTTWFDQADCLVGGYSGDTPLPSSSSATAYAGGFAPLVARVGHCCALRGAHLRRHWHEVRAASPGSGWPPRSEPPRTSVPASDEPRQHHDDAHIHRHWDRRPRGCGPRRPRHLVAPAWSAGCHRTR